MKLIRVQFSKGRHSCESCGHTPINNLYFVQLDTGKEIIVGAECAEKLLGYSSSVLLTRYINAAKREWKQQKPAPKEGETREDYLTRRVAEKLNARKAWQAWKEIERSGGWGGCRTIARQRLYARGVYEPGPAGHSPGVGGHTEHYVTCPKCQWKIEADKAFEQALKDEGSQIIREIERQYQANAWDFVGVPGWKL